MEIRRKGEGKRKGLSGAKEREGENGEGGIPQTKIDHTTVRDESPGT